MSTLPPSPVTKLLAAVGQGDAAAHERLWSLVYDELHRIARAQMADEAPGRTLQTTALVNEAYLRLVGSRDVQWAGRRHFFAAAANAMRRIRIDDARRRARLKRGGSGAGTEARRHGGTQGGAVGPRGQGVMPDAQWRGPGPDEGPAVFDDDPAELLALDEALTRLEQKDPRKAEVVGLRYFTGLSVHETADVLRISPRTVDREWVFARAWLRRELA